MTILNRERATTVGICASIMGVVILAFAAMAGNIPVTKAFPTGYNTPDDLFYVFLKEDRPYMSQSVKEHFARNGYLATDIATNKRELPVYAPSFVFLDGDEQDEERKYKVKVVENIGTMGKTVELHWKEDGIKRAFTIGHMATIGVKDGDKVRTGDLLGISGGCEGKLQLEEKSTGCHVHIEYSVEGRVTPYPEYLYNNHGDALAESRGWKTRKADPQWRMELGMAIREDADIYLEMAENINPDMALVLSRVVSAVHGAEGGHCAKDCQMSLAGARGAMQFMPATWEAYGCDGDEDRVADVESLTDAICGGANYLNSLYINEASQNVGLEDKWIFWKAAYRYNAGYQTPATHKDGFPSAVAYADGVVEAVEKMGGFH